MHAYKCVQSLLTCGCPKTFITILVKTIHILCTYRQGQRFSPVDFAMGRAQSLVESYSTNVTISAKSQLVRTTLRLVENSNFCVLACLLTFLQNKIIMTGEPTHTTFKKRKKKYHVPSYQLSSKKGNQ